MRPGLGLGPQQLGKGQLEPDPLELPLGEPWAQQPHKWGFPSWLRGLICVGTHSGSPICWVLIAWSPRESQWKNKLALMWRSSSVCVCVSGALGQHVGCVPVPSISLAVGCQPHPVTPSWLGLLLCVLGGGTECHRLWGRVWVTW